MKKWSWSASVRMLVGTGWLVCTMAVHAATEAETRALLGTLQLDRVLRGAITEVNTYQLGKRLKAMQPAGQKPTEQAQAMRAARLKAFALTLERVLAWPAVEPVVVESVSKGLSSEEVAQLNAFLGTPAGRIYIEDFQYMPAPVANAVDAYVDGLVDQLIDEPLKPLSVVGKLTEPEQEAAKLLQKLQSPAERADIESRRERFLKAMEAPMRKEAERFVTNVVSKMKDPPADMAVEPMMRQRMEALGQVYSVEQMNWRAARVVSARMAPERVKTLSMALDDAATAKLLQKLGEVSQGAGAAISQHLQKDPSFVEMLKTVLSPGG